MLRADPLISRIVSPPRTAVPSVSAVDTLSSGSTRRNTSAAGLVPAITAFCLDTTRALALAASGTTSCVVMSPSPISSRSAISIGSGSRSVIQTPQMTAGAHRHRRPEAGRLGREGRRSYRDEGLRNVTAPVAQRLIQSFPAKKDSGSARQGETANTETCDYPNRLNLTPLTATISGAFEKFCDFRKKSLAP